jgi:cytoskeletal protein CcmA (bactofilin family)
MTNIGRTLLITGELTSDEDVAISGQVQGPISIRSAALTVTESGRLDGDLRASRVVIRGTVDGSITASERIELQPSAVVNGSLSANRVVIADGATFNGSIDMDQRTIAAKVAQYKAAQAQG